ESGLTAVVSGVALACAVVPVIFTLAEEALLAVPRSYVEASTALGAARWQTTLRVVLPAASPGIAAGVALGLGRAVGEVMIVLMASGNGAIVSANLADSERTVAAMVIGLATLAVILFDVVRNGPPHRSWAFLTEAPREGMTAGGIFPAIIGMLEMVILMTLAGVPVGVATAIYLHEYSSPISPVTRAIRIAVANLAGVPSIVFGLFGLGFFVQFLGAGIDKAFFHGEKVFGQPALIW